MSEALAVAPRRARPSRRELEAAIRAQGGNLTATAAALGCSRATLYQWIYRAGLERLAGVDLTRDAKPAPALADETRVPRTVAVSEALWRWVRIRAIEQDSTAAAVVEEALALLRAKVGGAS